MSKNSLPRILGALLLYEQTPETRALVDAPVGTKAGQFVDYLPREGKKLVALSDEQNGKVVVQPFNCVINAELLDLDEARAAASTEGTFEGLQKDGDPYGIMYIGLPKDTPQPEEDAEEEGEESGTDRAEAAPSVLPVGAEVHGGTGVGAEVHGAAEIPQPQPQPLAQPADTGSGGANN